MSHDLPIEELQIIRQTYTDEGGWTKINLRIQFNPDKLEYSDPAFTSIRRRLAQYIEECVKEHQKARKIIDYLPTVYYDSVTETDTGQRDFGAFTDDLIGRLQQHYHVEVSNKE